MNVSIIIPTRNRQKDVIECLKSISIQSLKPNEIIVVDASDDQRLRHELNKLELAPVNLIYLYDQSGLTHGRNIGVQKATGEIILFLDDDVILEKDYVKEIVNVFKEDTKKEIGGVMGTNSKAHRPRFLSRMVHSLFFLVMDDGNGKIRPSGMPTFCYFNNSVTDVEVLTGYEMNYRREVFDYYQFDENLTGYCWNEDIDFSYRVSKRYRLVFNPFAKLWRKHGGGKFDQRLRKKMIICNHAYLFRKNMPQRLRNKLAFYISLLGMVVKTILLQRSPRGLLGVVDGLIEVFVRGNPSFPRRMVT